MSGSPLGFWHPTFFWHGLRYQAHIWCGESKDENVFLGVYNLGFGIQMVLRRVMQVTKIKKMQFFFTSGKFLWMIWLYCLRILFRAWEWQNSPMRCCPIEFHYYSFHSWSIYVILHLLHWVLSHLACNLRRPPKT